MKKILCLLLAVLLCIGLFPTSVLAENDALAEDTAVETAQAVENEEAPMADEAPAEEPVLTEKPVSSEQEAALEEMTENTDKTEAVNSESEQSAVGETEIAAEESFSEEPEEDTEAAVGEAETADLEGLEEESAESADAEDDLFQVEAAEDDNTGFDSAKEIHVNETLISEVQTGMRAFYYFIPEETAVYEFNYHRDDYAPAYETVGTLYSSREQYDENESFAVDEFPTVETILQQGVKYYFAVWADPDYSGTTVTVSLTLKKLNRAILYEDGSVELTIAPDDFAAFLFLPDETAVYDVVAEYVGGEFESGFLTLAAYHGAGTGGTNKYNYYGATFSPLYTNDNGGLTEQLQEGLRYQIGMINTGSSEASYLVSIAQSESGLHPDGKGNYLFRNQEDLDCLVNNSYSETTNAYYQGYAPFTLGADTAIPMNLNVNFVGCSMTVPSGTVLTVPEGSVFRADMLTVEGTLINYGRVSADILTVEGTLTNYGGVYGRFYWGDGEITFMGKLTVGGSIENHGMIEYPNELSGLENIRNNENGYVILMYTLGEEDDLAAMVNIANSDSDLHNWHEGYVYKPFSITQTFDLPVSCSVYVRNNVLTIAETGLVQTNSDGTYMSYICVDRNGTLIINGTLVNNSGIDVCDTSAMICTENKGVYTGSGWLGVEDNGEGPFVSHLTGFAEEDFSIDHNDNSGFWVLRPVGDEPADHQAGDQITWKLENGILSLSGTGDMWDYDVEAMNAPPWYNDRDEILKVEVSEGITGIGSWAFAELANLEEVNLSDSVTRLGDNAFANSGSLTEIDLPTALTELGEYAFYGSGLTGIQIPDGLAQIAAYGFMGCSNLKAISIPNSIKKVEYGCFTGCDALTGVTYGGTEEQWKELVIEDGNEPLLNAEITYAGHVHTPGEAVRENEVAATCKAEGSYDEVIYCTVCSEELSRETKTVEKLAHTPGEAVRENEVAATCTEEGSYDEVICCTVCSEELSRGTKTVEALGHDYVNGVCTRCGEKEPGKIVFEDVADPAAYYYNPVYWAAANGITSGTSPTTFSPGKSCTRGQIVTFLWKALGSPEPSSTNNPFTDVKESDYFYKPVLWAKENGVTSGKTATTFEPASPCTRGQIATFLWKALNSPEPDSTSNPFSDVKTDDYFFKPVLWAKENSITSGTSATTFSPGNTCTRAQAMTFLWIASGRPGN